MYIFLFIYFLVLRIIPRADIFCLVLCHLPVYLQYLGCYILEIQPRLPAYLSLIVLYIYFLQFFRHSFSLGFPRFPVFILLCKGYSGKLFILFIHYPSVLTSKKLALSSIPSYIQCPNFWNKKKVKLLYWHRILVTLDFIQTSNIFVYYVDIFYSFVFFIVLPILCVF